MRTLIIVFLLAATAFAGDTNTFWLCQIPPPYADSPKAFVTTNRQGAGVVFVLTQPLLEQSKALLITNGMTLGQVVANLGPGWQTEVEGAGIVRWSFADGRELNVWPSKYTADEVISTNETARCRFWFDRATPMAIIDLLNTNAPKK